jgi:hypothetical protein
MLLERKGNGAGGPYYTLLRNASHFKAKELQSLIELGRPLQSGQPNKQHPQSLHHSGDGTEISYSPPRIIDHGSAHQSLKHSNTAATPEDTCTLHQLDSALQPDRTQPATSAMPSSHDDSPVFRDASSTQQQLVCFEASGLRSTSSPLLPSACEQKDSMKPHVVDDAPCQLEPKTQQVPAFKSKEETISAEPKSSSAGIASETEEKSSTPTSQRDTKWPESFQTTHDVSANTVCSNEAGNVSLNSTCTPEKCIDSTISRQDADVVREVAEESWQISKMASMEVDATAVSIENSPCCENKNSVTFDRNATDTDPPGLQNTTRNNGEERSHGSKPETAHTEPNGGTHETAQDGGTDDTDSETSVPSLCLEDLLGKMNRQVAPSGSSPPPVLYCLRFRLVKLAGHGVGQGF